MDVPSIQRRTGDAFTGAAVATVPVALFGVIKHNDPLVLIAAILGAAFCLIAYLALRTPRSHL